MIVIKKYFNSNAFYILLLFCFSCLYFLRLFIPNQQIFITPDVYSSDLIHINYSLKHMLSASLKMNQFPYWDWNTGNGFPLIGESQIGAFYVMNVILFKLLPFTTAFNVGYILSFFIASLGSYLFFNTFVKNKFLVFISALLFAYSAPMFVQISHYNLLQTYSLIPLTFYFYELLCKVKERRSRIIIFLILALVLSQQFFAGYVMTSFMTILMVFLYFFLRYIVLNRSIQFAKLIKKSLIQFSLLGVIVLLLSSIQLIPLLEFSVYSVRNTSTNNLSSQNSLNPQVLLTYLKFDYYGAFSSATKTINSIVNFSQLRNVLWDGNLFIGVLPIVSIILFSLYFFRDKKIMLFFSLFLISTLFAFGVNSPLSFFYGFPPFSLFRTPFRFTIFMTFFSVALFLLSTDKAISYFGKKYHIKIWLRTLVYILGILTIILLIKSSFKYHKTVQEKEFINNEVERYLVNTFGDDFKSNQSTIYSFGNELVWYQTMLYKKWSDTPIYLFFMKDMSSYLNTLYDIPSSNIFFASFFSPKNQFYIDNYLRLTLLKDLEKKGIDFTFEPATNYRNFLIALYHNDYSVPIEIINLFRLKGVKYFITPINYVETDDIKKLKDFSLDYEGFTYTLHIYVINNSVKRFYITNTYYPINTINDGIRLLKSPHEYPTVFGYTNIEVPSSLTNNIRILYLNQVGREINMHTIIDNPGLLVTTISNYPGMRVFIDGKNTKISEVNFNQIAFPVDKGTHSISIRYQPAWFTISIMLSFLSALLVWVIIFFLLIRKLLFKFLIHP